jgi:hypothetical protein
VTPPPQNQQLEFVLPFNKREDYKNVFDYFEDKFKLIQQQNDIINSKLNELLTQKREKYARKPKSQPNV